MKLSRGLARFNKSVTNRIQGLYAWLVPPWAVILHRGRRSGRQYRTPLLAFRRGRTLVIALVYGEESDWLRNVREGGGHVIRAGRTFIVGPLEVIETRDAGSLLARLSPPERAYCRLAEKLAIVDGALHYRDARWTWHDRLRMIMRLRRFSRRCLPRRALRAACRPRFSRITR